MFKKNAKGLAKSLVGAFLVFTTPAFAQDNIQENINTSSLISAPINIKENKISDVGLWGINATDDNIKQFDTSLWENSNTYNLNYLFGTLDNSVQFPIIQKLLRNIVFSGGTAPNATITTANNRFLLAYRLGPVENVKTLFSGYPNIIDQIYLSSLYADTLLANGEKDAACNLVAGLNPKTPNKQILELRSVCYALNKEGAAAQLSLDLSKTIGAAQPYEAWLTKAITFASAFDGNPEILGNFTFRADNGRQLALSNYLGLKPSPAQINGLSPLVVSSLIKSNPSQELINRARLLGLNYSNLIETDIESVSLAQSFIDFYISAFGSSKSLETYALSEKTNASIIDAALLIGNFDAAKKIGDIYGYTEYQNLIFALKANNPIIQNEDLLRSLKDKSLVNIAIAAGLPINDYSLVYNNLSAKNLQNIEALDYALERKSSAEIILNIALLLKGQDPKTIDVFTISKAIKSLKFIGLETEAKELAIYTILAKSISLYKPKPSVPAKPVAKPPVKPPVKPTTKQTQEKPNWGQQID